MLTVTISDLKKDTKNIQNLAHHEPVLIEGGDSKQVLLDYDHYQKIVGKDADKPFVSLYDTFVNIASQFSDEERAILADIDDESDFSVLDRK